jgi:hypothetical protein
LRWYGRGGAVRRQQNANPHFPDGAGAARSRGPAEYLSLYTYLEHRASTIVLTFEQRQALLGFALPERCIHRARLVDRRCRVRQRAL